MARQRLLFVYNADGGPLNALWDAGHKLFSPATYPCALCAITYGAVAMRREWRDYVERLPRPAVFLHRDEFRSLFPDSGIALPAILLDDGAGGLAILISSADFSPRMSVQDLSKLLDQRLSQHLVRPEDC